MIQLMIGSGVWGTLTNFNGFRVLAALLHGTLHRVSEKLDPLLFHHIFALTATNGMKIVRSS